MKITKKLSVLLLTVAFGLLATACGSTENTETPESPDNPEEPTVEPVEEVTTKYYFEAEAGEIVNQNPTIAESSAARYYPNNGDVSYPHGGTGFLANVTSYTLRYSFYSSTDASVKLYFMAARSNGTNTYPFVNDLKVNESSESVTDFNAIYEVTESEGWYTWQEFYVAELSFTQGDNVLDVEFGFNFNIDQLVIEAPETTNIVMSDDVNGHNYTDWVVTSEATETETGRLYRYCTTCKITDEHTLPVWGENSGYESNYVNSSSEKTVGYNEVTVDGETYIVYDEVSNEATIDQLFARDSVYSQDSVAQIVTNPVAMEASLTVSVGEENVLLMSLGSKVGDIVFDFTVSEDAGVEFILDICRYSNSSNFYLDMLTFILDGEEIAISDQLVIEGATNWNTLAPTSLFVRNLTSGDHTLTVRARGGQCGTLLGLSLNSLTTISWTNVASQD